MKLKKLFSSYLYEAIVLPISFLVKPTSLYRLAYNQIYIHHLSNSILTATKPFGDKFDFHLTNSYRIALRYLAYPGKAVKVQMTSRRHSLPTFCLTVTIQQILFIINLFLLVGIEHAAVAFTVRYCLCAMKAFINIYRFNTKNVSIKE